MIHRRYFTGKCCGYFKKVKGGREQLIKMYTISSVSNVFQDICIKSDKAKMIL